MWQPARTEDLVKIQSKLLLVSDCDLPTWSISKKGVFNCADTWEVIRHRHQQIQWWKAIWFLLAIPRQAFFLWLAVRQPHHWGEIAKVGIWR
jgi:hypothetical protein